MSRKNSFFFSLLSRLLFLGPTLPKTSIAPENRPTPQMKVASQPPFLRGYVSFREGSGKLESFGPGGLEILANLLLSSLVKHFPFTTGCM